jgi:hypothetical protein
MVNKGATVANKRLINANNKLDVALQGEVIPTLTWTGACADTTAPKNRRLQAASLDNPSTSTIEEPGRAESQ